MEWLDSFTNSIGMDFGKFGEIAWDKGAWYGAVHGVTKSQIQLSDWTIAATVGCFRGMEIEVLLLRTDHVPNTKDLNDTMLIPTATPWICNTLLPVKWSFQEVKESQYIHSWLKCSGSLPFQCSVLQDHLHRDQSWNTARQGAKESSLWVGSHRGREAGSHKDIGKEKTCPRDLRAPGHTSNHQLLESQHYSECASSPEYLEYP